MCEYALYHVDETYVGTGFYFLLNDQIVRPLLERFHAFDHNGLAFGDKYATYRRVEGGPLYRVGYPNPPEKAHHILEPEGGRLFATLIMSDCRRNKMFDGFTKGKSTGER